MRLERLARRWLPPPVARAAKRVGVYPRYWAQARACRAGYRQYGHLYRQNVLFIAGLPKSGTTWLKKMLASYPGYEELLIPEVAAYEMETGGSHDYELPGGMFARFEGLLVVSKMHVHGSRHNVEVLRGGGVRYVVVYRDLRDVAVSYFYYVRQTPWHPEHPVYADLGVEEGLDVFAERTLLAYAAWVRSWRENGDAELGLVVRYEEMHGDTAGVLTRVAGHFELESGAGRVEEIVAAHSFQRLSGGRVRGEEDRDSFFRRGRVGDWREHFSVRNLEVYKGLIGDSLIEFGYEKDLDW
jgi:hypothetical protein